MNNIRYRSQIGLKMCIFYKNSPFFGAPYGSDKAPSMFQTRGGRVLMVPARGTVGGEQSITALHLRKKRQASVPCQPSC